LCGWRGDPRPLPLPKQEDLQAAVAHLGEAEKGKVFDLLAKHAACLGLVPGRSNIVTHKINLKSGARPTKKPTYPIKGPKLEFMKAQLEEMLRNGVISPSASEWSSPVVIAKKNEGQYRFCVDYRGPNAETELDKYDTPNLHHLLRTLGKCAVMSSLDLRAGFWQQELDIESRPITAFRTAFGFYEFNVLPFGLKIAPRVSKG